MRSTSFGIWGGLAALGVGLAGLVGCAVGTDATTDDLALDAVTVDGGDDDAAPSMTVPSTTPDDDAGDPGLVADDAGVDADVDAGADAGGSGGGGGGGGGGGTSCNAVNTCAGAEILGAVRGDNGSDTQTTQGTASKWFTIDVNEDDSSVFSNSEEMKAVLTSPPGVNFDLYVYAPSSIGSHECATVSKQSTNTSGADTVGLEWGESGTFANNSDDSRTVTVEVRYVSGTCSPGASWTLTVTGNQH